MSCLNACDFPDLNAAILTAIAERSRLELEAKTYKVTSPVVIPSGVKLKMLGFSHCDTIIDYTECNGPFLITDQAIKWLEISNLRVIGRGEFFRQYCTTPSAKTGKIVNNTGGHWTTWVHDCVFESSGPAWSCQTPDSPHALFERNLFLGNGDNALGIVWRGNPTNFMVRNNVFGNHRHGIAMACDGGGYFRFVDNEFFNFSPRPKDPTAHYWILPGMELGGDGRGGEIGPNKHGNEYSDKRDTVLLVGDADQYDLTLAKLVKKRSEGRLREITITKENIAMVSDTTPAIVSYTPNIERSKLWVNLINNRRPVIGSGLDDAGTPVLTSAEIATLNAQVTAW